MGDGRHREGRAAEDGLPRPAQPHHPRRGRPAHQQRHPEAPIDLDHLPLDDPKTFEIFQRGETKGVFQFESAGIRDLLIKMKPDRFTDIIATNALYRPGPLNGGMVDEFVDVKNGRKQAVYLHPVLKEVLEETYGVMSYQEQVMRDPQPPGGRRSSRGPYATIKAISKKKADVDRAEPRPVHRRRRVGRRNLEREKAAKIFDLIEYSEVMVLTSRVLGETTLVEAESGERTTVAAALSLPDSRCPNAMLHGSGRMASSAAGRSPTWSPTDRGPSSSCEPAQGRRIVATGNHPFRTLDGWTNLEDRPGDRIAAPRRLTIAGGESWPKHELIALAGLLSEGNTCHPTCLYFYNNSREFVDDFVAAVEAFPDTTARVTSRRGPVRGLCEHGDQRYPFRPGPPPLARRSTAVRATSVTRGYRRPPGAGLIAGPSRWASSAAATEKSIPDGDLPASETRTSRLPGPTLVGRWAFRQRVAERPLLRDFLRRTGSRPANAAVAARRHQRRALEDLQIPRD